jgi:uncharacterized protein YjbI with pentapeptide repeats
MIKMTAQEVVDRHKGGKLDFQGVDLRGQSFKKFEKLSLAGADFSGADIRGTNFANTNLSQAKFIGAIGGIQKRWWLGQQLLGVGIGFLSGILSAFSSLLMVYFFSIDGISQGYLFPGILSILLLLAIQLFLAWQGFTTKALNLIFLAVAVAVAVAVALALTGAVAVALALTGAVAVALALALAVAGAGAGAFSLFSVYIAWETRKGNEKFRLLRIWGNAFGSIGGTSFAGSDLTGADFKGAMLKSTNLHNAILTHVFWKDVQKLDFARWGESILANSKTRKLLISCNGEGQDYQNLNLSGVNLSESNLIGANFKQANLSRSILRYANLTNANLTEAIFIDTDLTNVTLTGAYLQGWNIDHSTKLDDVECEFVNLLEKPNKIGSLERRPHDPDKVFQPGDFEKLYRKIITTVELLLRGGGNPEAFRAAFQQLMAANPDISPDSIQSVEKVGDDVKLIIAVSEGSDKAKIERDFDKFYTTAELETAKATALLESERSHTQDLKEMHLATVNGLGGILSNLTINTTAMNDSNNPSISAGDKSFIVTGKMETSNSAINVGDISGKVTNTINQLPDTDTTDPNQPNLKELLTQLQAAIEGEEDPRLSDGDKADLLGEVENLAKAKQTEEPTKKEGLVRKAKKMFDATLTTLPAAATLAKASNELLPVILKLLGSPA